MFRSIQIVSLQWCFEAFHDLFLRNRNEVINWWFRQRDWVMFRYFSDSAVIDDLILLLILPHNVTPFLPHQFPDTASLFFFHYWSLFSHLNHFRFLVWNVNFDRNCFILHGSLITQFCCFLIISSIPSFFCCKLLIWNLGKVLRTPKSASFCVCSSALLKLTQFLETSSMWLFFQRTYGHEWHPNDEQA